MMSIIPRGIPGLQAGQIGPLMRVTTGACPELSRLSRSSVQSNDQGMVNEDLGVVMRIAIIGDDFMNILHFMM